MSACAHAPPQTFLQVTNKGNPLTGTPFDYGAGHINATAALDPGLIYDMGLLVGAMTRLRHKVYRLW